MDFKVEMVSKGKTCVVFARPLQEGSFSLSAQPSLGGAAIKQSYSKMRSHNNDGTPRPTLYGFQLVSPDDVQKFHVGDRVTLG